MALIKLDEATVQAALAETVSKDLFEREFGGLKKRLEKQEDQSFQVIIGVLIASVLILVALAVQIWLFCASYNQNFLEAQATFGQNITDLKKENVEAQATYKYEIERIKEKLDDLESLLLQKASEVITNGR